MKKITALLTALALILGLCACSAKNELASWQEQYDLGIRYLSEGNYEGAIIAFNAAIEIDPKQADAYIGLADAYVALGDAERAGQVLEDALSAVSDPDAIQSRLDALGGGEPEATPGQTPAPTAGPTQGPTVEPTQPLPASSTSEPTSGATSTPAPTSEPTPMPEATAEPTPTPEPTLEPTPEPTPTPAPESNPDFTIENGVLVKYNGSGGAVTIPNSVTSIGDGAFDGCISLTSVTIPNSVTRIEAIAFQHCDNLNRVSIPGSVTTIGLAAFYGCDSLSTVTIPSSVTGIGPYAFDACFRLTIVYFGGSEAQWNQITMGEGNGPLLNATIHYNS